MRWTSVSAAPYPALKVAEHLPEAQTRSFVETLCKASNVVLFSVAIK